MQALTNHIQTWLIESENPLVELYRYLRMLIFLISIWIQLNSFQIIIVNHYVYIFSLNKYEFISIEKIENFLFS